jgi:hypothetical protein
MKEQEKLLDKYYRGETSVEEEKVLKNRIISNENDSAEKDMFRYFQNESVVPDDLEETIFSALQKRQSQNNQLKIRIISIISAAAAILVIVSIYLNIQTGKNTEMENNFFVMEQALLQVSESIQPDEQEEMLVLWVDNDVEIIIN